MSVSGLTAPGLRLSDARPSSLLAAVGRPDYPREHTRMGDDGLDVERPDVAHDPSAHSLTMQDGTALRDRAARWIEREVSFPRCG